MKAKSLKHLSRKDRFVYGIIFAAFVVTLSGGVADIMRHRYPQAVVQIVLGLVALILFFYYRKDGRYNVLVYSGIFAGCLGYDILLYLDHFVLHSYLILMIIPMVIFFMLPLRQALVASLLHYLAVILISWYAHVVMGVDSDMFTSNAMQVYIFGGAFILAFGIFYQLAIEESYRRLEHANTQKALLLQEIHHRIKNNLNKMSSALGLQILRIHDEHCDDTKEILRKNKLRIEAMSMVHEALYRSEDISRIDAGDYTRRLLDLISQSYEKNTPHTISSDECALPLEKALRLGTILNELYTNTIKHSSDNTSIEITLTPIEDRCRFVYTQIGSHDITNPKQLTKSSGLGMMLVKLSAKEIGGELQTTISKDSIVFEIVFEMEE